MMSWQALVAKRRLDSLTPEQTSTLDTLEAKVPVPTHCPPFNGGKPEKIDKHMRVIYWVICAHHDGLITGAEFDGIGWKLTA